MAARRLNFPGPPLPGRKNPNWTDDEWDALVDAVRNIRQTEDQEANSEAVYQYLLQKYPPGVANQPAWGLRNKNAIQQKIQAAHEIVTRATIAAHVGARTRAQLELALERGLRQVERDEAEQEKQRATESVALFAQAASASAEDRDAAVKERIVAEAKAKSAEEKLRELSLQREELQKKIDMDRAKQVQLFGWLAGGFQALAANPQLLSTLPDFSALPLLPPAPNIEPTVSVSLPPRPQPEPQPEAMDEDEKATEAAE